MKKIFSTIAALLIIVECFAQYSYQTVNTQQVRKDLGPIASDNNGNIIITGIFATTLTLGGFTLSNNNNFDQAFVAKKLPDGSFAWVKMIAPLSIPQSPSYAHINGVCTDAAGNVYLTGSFIGKISFGNNVTLTSSKSGSIYTGDIFAAKISPGGVVVWAKSAGTVNDGCNAGENGTSITTDNAGDVYVTGQIVWKVFKNTSVCNEIPGGPVCSNATSKSITCPYVVKYSAVGTKIWERKYVNNGVLASTSCWANHPQGTNIRSDGTDIYVNGYFYGNVDFGAGTLSTGSETTSNSFLIKLNSNGTTIWSKSVTGFSNYPYGVGDDLLVDGNDIYISGIGENISFGACSLPMGPPPSFFAKYSSSGSCQWAINQRGISYGVVKHPNGNLAMLRRGRFFRVMEFSPLDGTVVDSIVTPLEDTATGSWSGYPAFASLPDGFIFSHMVTGTYHFGNLTIAASVPLASGWGDMMLIKYTAPAPTVANRSIIQQESISNKIILYPNPATNQIMLRNKNDQLLGTVSIYDISGQMIYKKFIGSYQTKIDVKNFSAGVYYIRSSQLQPVLKFIKQ